MQPQTTGQQIANLLAVIAAMVGGTQIKTSNFAEPVEVLAVLRDNNDGAPVYVRLATAGGHVQHLLDELELIES